MTILGAGTAVQSSSLIFFPGYSISKHNLLFTFMFSYGILWLYDDYEDACAQNWVRYQNGTINEGGQNQTPRKWDNETGLNNNPVKRRKKSK